MKKLFTFLLCAIFLLPAAQWAPTTGDVEQVRENTNVKNFYRLDIQLLKNQLKSAQEMGQNAVPVIISLPTLEGKIERFSVYSFPVVVKELADQYQLGSYIGVGVDDPSKSLRFSLAPNDFQSMIIKGGRYEFIEPQNTAKTVYGVHPKTTEVGNDGFLCSMNENVLTKKQIADLYKKGKSFTNNPSEFSKASDKKYRTLRLAISVTGEYTTFFGTVANALTAINATLTRVNGVFEKDFALHLNLQNFPNIIYTSAGSDPYSNAVSGGNPAWNTQLQTTLTNNVGNSNYDIGHLFARTGGGGNAGCIGCMCVDPTAAQPRGKGSAFTSPSNGIPQGDTFDIDYVAHEMGHQLGANHTFSYDLEGSGVNMEPGSGSTIMGYAGIVPGSNVQPNSDGYFHVASILQVGNNLNSKTCDVENVVTNNPPVIAPLQDYNIPKGTAFVLTASAIDPEGSTMTYTWEQFDDAGTEVLTTTGNNSTGPLFRSLSPSLSPIRYFPNLTTVLSGNLISTAQWESVSNVPRETNFAITVRDNDPVSTSQQTSSALQTLMVGNDGPFQIISTNVYNNGPASLVWDVANTNGSFYNVPNVKIDYTTNNGTTWNVLAASTPNDGSEPFNLSTLATGATLIVRISSIGNVFYAVKNVTVAAMAACSSAAPTNLTVSGIGTNQATLSWAPLSGATYIIRYRAVGSPTWTTIPVTTNAYTLTGLLDGSQYEFQIANVCAGVPGTFSSIGVFSTNIYMVCPATSENANDEYISNVTVTPTLGPVMSSASGASLYTNYSSDPSRLITLKQGTAGNTISVTKAWTAATYAEGVGVWIDFNRDGNFADTEKILSTLPNAANPVTGTFNVPLDAYSGNLNLVMRVVMQYNNTATSACANIAFGEIEDYAVRITPTLGVSEAANSGIQFYPNPATDVLNITKVSDKATYTIHNTVGQIVSKGNVKDNKVSVDQLTKGVYIITLNYEGKMLSHKFIKK
ncbi:MAG: fibronectin type III domain-containing protein [Kaistella sp.]|nr:fibronectin type III domain-containing protein [Kaistella sp.]